MDRRGAVIKPGGGENPWSTFGVSPNILGFVIKELRPGCGTTLRAGKNGPPGDEITVFNKGDSFTITDSRGNLANFYPAGQENQQQKTNGEKGKAEGENTQARKLGRVATKRAMI